MSGRPVRRGPARGRSPRRTRTPRAGGPRRPRRYCGERPNRRQPAGRGIRPEVYCATRMERAGTVSIAIVRVLLRVLDGASAQRLVDELGISAAQLADDDARLPRDVASRAWRLAPELTGDPPFGIHLAGRVPFGAFRI